MELLNVARTFLYFAYASNLLGSRLHISNPSATRFDIAKLNDYRLDFVHYAQRWNGSIANVTPYKGEHVWGALWEMDMKDLDNLDRQEGVNADFYVRYEVDVETLRKGSVKCFIYISRRHDFDRNFTLNDLPMTKRPSLVYMRTIIKGAKESHLPQYYVEMLENVAHNGFNETVDVTLPC